MMENRLGVIFDVDGVLVDSSRAHYQSWLALADESGLPRMSEAEFTRTFGRTTREIIVEYWPDERRSDAAVAAMDDRKEVLFREILRDGFPAMPGAAALIDGLSEAGFLLAAGSSGPPENVSLALEGLGRRDRFQAVVTGVDVQRGKPDPQVFQLCAERLGLAPGLCAVVEDAEAGVAAANAAGTLSVGLVSTGHRREEFAEADHVVDCLGDLSPERLRGWIEAR